MQMVTVAIADPDPGRRIKLEQSIQGGDGIRVLANVMLNGSDVSSDRRFNLRSGTTAIEEEIARISRLKPRILFVSLDHSEAGDFPLLEALRRECPETFVVLLTDKSSKEEQIMQGLANGARGCLNREADPFYFLKAARVVDRGEIWVTRQMLGKIMNKVICL